MSVSYQTGPGVTGGPLASVQSGVPEQGSTIYGPSLEYQGSTIPDVRFQIPKDRVIEGSIRAFLDSPYIRMLNFVPSASAATPVNIAAAQATTSGTALTLAAASTGITPAVPFFQMTTVNVGTIPTLVESSTPTLSGLTLDYGFTTLNCTSGNPVVAATSTTVGLFYQGQNLYIGSVGASGAPLAATVTLISGNNLTLSVAPQATNTAAPVGQGNNMSPLQVGTSVAWTPRAPAGAVGPLNPLDALTRGIGIAGSTSATGGAFLVRGYDLYGQPMSETITAAAGAGLTYGKKTYKHIASVTPQFTDTHTYSVGTSDVFGFAVRSDQWEDLNLFVAGSYLTFSNGWVAGDLTNPATSITGDVRGTVQIGARGQLSTGGAPAGSALAAASISGSVRLTFFISMPLYNLTAATNANPAPMFGSTQA